MRYIHSLLIITFGLILTSCNDNFIQEIYQDPTAKFEVKPGLHTGEYEVFESVVFSNVGSGGSYVVFPGDTEHKFGVAGNTGFTTATNGTFSYSYQEVGNYTAVWVASSIDGNGKIIEKIDSTVIKVVSTNGGIDQFYLSNFYTMPEYSTVFKSYSKAISADTLVCPILYAGWNNFKTFSNLSRIITNFSLSSTLSKLYWLDASTGIEKELKTGSTSSTDGISLTNSSKLSVQKLIVKTASGFTSNYYLAATVIPNFTKFSVNIGGIDYSAIITRDISYYDRFNVQLTLPAGADISALTPVFELVGNDVNLTDGTNYDVTVNGVKQTSGASIQNFSSKKLTYEINMWMLGAQNKKIAQKATMLVTIQ